MLIIYINIASNKTSIMDITVNYRGIDFDVDFDYDPAEEQTRDHEGCAAQITWIHEFKHQGTCFLEWIEDEEYDVKECILETLRD